MIIIERALPLPNLHNLELSEIAIRSNGESGFIAYLDFNDSFCLESNRVSEDLQRLNTNQTSSNLSFSGWLGFFGYEFLASNLGLSLLSTRDLDVPDGWFGRPQTIIHLLSDQTKIESSLPNRAQEIADSLEFSTIYNLDKIEFSTTAQKCNLDFADYKKIFTGAREAILNGESYQIKI